MSANKEKELRKNNRNICVTRISSPVNGAKITFETYNSIKDVLLHSLSVGEYKTKQNKKCRYWDFF
jgi:hypothetical protein